MEKGEQMLGANSVTFRFHNKGASDALQFLFICTKFLNCLIIFSRNCNTSKNFDIGKYLSEQQRHFERWVNVLHGQKCQVRNNMYIRFRGKLLLAAFYCTY